MKILQVIQFFNPSKGGSVIFPFNLSKDLAKKGHDITLLTTDYDFSEDLYRSITQDGVKVITFHSEINFFELIYSPSIVDWLKKHISEFDVIHLHNYRTYQNYVVSKFAEKHSIPYIIQPHGDIPIFLEKRYLKKFFDLFVGREMLKCASKVIASTKTDADQFKFYNIDVNKTIVLPNGIDLSLYNNLPLKGAFKTKYDINPDVKLILYLGRIHEIKGIDLLIDSFFDLTQEMDNINLAIVGPDAGFLNHLLKKVEDLGITDKVFFSGQINEPDKLAAFTDAEIFVLPSQYECFSLTVLEAWACGIPAIISDGCMLSDFLPNKEIIFQRDKNHLKNLMKNILCNSNLRAKLKHESNQIIKNQFDWTKILDTYISIYANLIKKERKTYSRELFFDVHGVIKLKISGENSKLFNYLENEYSLFKTDEKIEPDLEIVLSNFAKDTSNTYKLRESEYIKKNFIYSDERYKLIKLNYCIKNIETQPILYINGNFFSGLLLKGFVIEPLMGLIAAQKGGVFLHASSVALKRQGYAFVADQGVGKTSILLEMLDRGAEYLSNEPSLISSEGNIFSFSNHIQIFNYNLLKNYSILKKLTLIEKFLIKIEYIVFLISLNSVKIPLNVDVSQKQYRIGTKYPLKRMFLMVKTTSRNVKISKCYDHQEFIKKIIFINRKEIQYFNEIIDSYQFITSKTIKEEFWKQTELNLLCCLNTVDCYKIEIPEIINSDVIETLFQSINDKNLD